MYIDTHIYTYIHTHMYIYIYIYTHMISSSSSSSSRNSSTYSCDTVRRMGLRGRARLAGNLRAQGVEQEA